jgi:thioredoxin 1
LVRLESNPTGGYRREKIKQRPAREEEQNMADVQEVGDSVFEAEVLQSPLPVLVDFWAPWCAPCRVIGPVVAELAKEYTGRLKVVKVNVDDHPQAPSRYGVRSIPNLVLFKGGQVRDQIVGAVPKAQLVKAIDQVV